MKSIGMYLAAAGLGLLLVACGGGDSDIRAEIAADFEESGQGMITSEEAECMADVIVDTLGAERARQYSDAMSGDMEAAAASEPLSSEEQQQFTEGFQECGQGMM